MPSRKQSKKIDKSKRIALLPGTAGAQLLSDLFKTGGSAFDEVIERSRKGAGKKHMVSKASFDEATARTTLWRLEKKGLVVRRARRYEVTDEGVRTIEMLHAEQITPAWDGKWRLVMFDIPEEKRHERNWLRYHLSLADYKPIQKSVFIGKHPLEEDVYQWLIDGKLDRCVRLLTVGDIDTDEGLDTR